jgi:hypothetical protein
MTVLSHETVGLVFAPAGVAAGTTAASDAHPTKKQMAAKSKIAVCFTIAFNSHVAEDGRNVLDQGNPPL